MSWYIEKIIIDSNEKHRGYRAYNYYNKTYDIDIERLDYGDYLFLTNDGKQAIFEFKTCKDFISSMENKSLFQELSNQTIHNEYSYLVVCGDFKETFEELYFEVPHYRYKYKSKKILVNRLTSQIKGALHRIYAMYIPVIFVNDEEEAFSEMLKVSSKIADAKKYGGIVRPSTDNLIGSPVEFFLTGIDGIGEKKARNITNKLKLECVDDLCGKKPSDFLSVNLITKRNVCDLWDKLHNESLEL